VPAYLLKARSTNIWEHGSQVAHAHTRTQHTYTRTIGSAPSFLHSAIPISSSSSETWRAPCHKQAMHIARVVPKECVHEILRAISKLLPSSVQRMPTLLEAGCLTRKPGATIWHEGLTVSRRQDAPTCCDQHAHIISLELQCSTRALL